MGKTTLSIRAEILTASPRTLSTSGRLSASPNNADGFTGIGGVRLQGEDLLRGTAAELRQPEISCHRLRPVCQGSCVQQGSHFHPGNRLVGEVLYLDMAV